MHYGHRGSDLELMKLTPHEFHASWAVERVRYPPRANGALTKVNGVEAHHNNIKLYHALLTPAAQSKLKSKVALEPGVDYVLRDVCGALGDKGPRVVTFPRRLRLEENSALKHSTQSIA